MDASLDTDVVIHLYGSGKEKMLNTVRRFSHQHGTRRDHQWLLGYCKKHNIALNSKMRELKKQLVMS